MSFKEEEKNVIELQWKGVQAKLKERFNKKPDLNAVLMLIGIQELGQLKTKFSKEQKQDLMHIGVCTLLSRKGYYEFYGLDDEGWPHFEATKDLPKMTVDEQEVLLKNIAIDYFEETENLT